MSSISLLLSGLRFILKISKQQEHLWKKSFFSSNLWPVLLSIAKEKMQIFLRRKMRKVMISRGMRMTGMSKMV